MHPKNSTLSKQTWMTHGLQTLNTKPSKSCHSLDRALRWAPHIYFYLDPRKNNLWYFFYVCCPSNAEVQAAKLWLCHIWVLCHFLAISHNKATSVTSAECCLRSICFPYEMQRKKKSKTNKQKKKKTLLPQGLSISPATWQGRHLFISWLQQCSPSVFVHYYIQCLPINTLTCESPVFAFALLSFILIF